jgi:hypothetical protein
VRQNDDGALEWRSPTGRGYRERPPGRVVFAGAPGHDSAPQPAALPF